MAKKKSVPTIIRTASHARSFRSMAVGWCTALFDAEYDGKLRNAKFNPFAVSRLQEPLSAMKKLRQWAKEGIWCAVESHPEIADADGVPGLDLILTQDNQPPSQGKWLTAGSQFLDLPTGHLTIAYEQEYFEDWYRDEFPVFDASDKKSECLSNSEFCDATSYKLIIEPGFYRIHAYTRDLANDSSFDGRHAQLVILLTPTKRPKTLGKADPLIPYAG